MKINRNIFYSEQLVGQFIRYNLKYVVISPGSRSTPLVFAFLNNKKIKPISILDERSAGFFAAGLARQTNSPVALVCTSGTAAVEYYPAIVEAYQQRIPLVICTADRPPELRNSGANQTINQFNLYSNHIRYFAEFVIGKPDIENVAAFRKSITEGLNIGFYRNKGPVHFNIAFKKPFEPDMFTDEIDILQYDQVLDKHISKTDTKLQVSKSISMTVNSLWKQSKLPIIVLGAGQYSDSFLNELNKFSKKYRVPIFVDINSSARFAANIDSALALYENYLNNRVPDKYIPDLAFMFGRYPISKALADYLKGLNIHKIIVNDYGDRFDPTSDGRTILAMNPRDIFGCLEDKPVVEMIVKEYLKELQSLENEFASVISKTLSRGKLTELSIIKTVVDQIPENSNVFISNSLIVRDFDRIVQNIKKKITIFQNRGASGIDGIISSALGMAFDSRTPSYLVIGDLAFLYDLTALSIGVFNNINLKIVLINNNGGRIFDYLPSARFKNIQPFFVTPQNINIKQACKAFGTAYYYAKSINGLLKKFSKLRTEIGLTVLECDVDNDISREEREKITCW